LGVPPPPHTACAPCAAGTFSVKGLVVDRWAELPRDFHTSCTGAFCKPWQLQGDTIDSGTRRGPGPTPAPALWGIPRERHQLRQQP